MDHFGGDKSDLWRAICNLGAPPKLSHFVWHACSGALATMDRLCERHIIEDGECGHCLGERETIVHAIFHCSLVQPIWKNSMFAHYLVDAPTTSFIDLFV